MFFYCNFIVLFVLLVFLTLGCASDSGVGSAGQKLGAGKFSFAGYLDWVPLKASVTAENNLVVIEIINLVLGSLFSRVNIDKQLIDNLSKPAHLKFLDNALEIKKTFSNNPYFTVSRESNAAIPKNSFESEYACFTESDWNSMNSFFVSLGFKSLDDFQNISSIIDNKDHPEVFEYINRIFCGFSCMNTLGDGYSYGVISDKQLFNLLSISDNLLCYIRARLTGPSFP